MIVLRSSHETGLIHYSWTSLLYRYLSTLLLWQSIVLETDSIPLANNIGNELENK